MKKLKKSLMMNKIEKYENEINDLKMKLLISKKL